MSRLSRCSAPWLGARLATSSDVEILIDVDPDVHFSLIDLFDIKALLESRLQRPVDVVTRGGLNPRLEKRVIEDAETVF